MKLSGKVTKNPRIKNLPRMMELDGPEMRKIRTVLDTEFVKLMKRLYATEGASGGEKWDKLSDAYKKQKERALSGAVADLTALDKQTARLRGKKFGGSSPKYKLATYNKILQYSGEMADSLRKKGHPKHLKEHTVKPRPLVRLGTKSEVAAYHAPRSPSLGRAVLSFFGVGKSNLPVRDPMQMTKSQKDGLLELVKGELIEKLKRMQRTLEAFNRKAA